MKTRYFLNTETRRTTRAVARGTCETILAAQGWREVSKEEHAAANRFRRTA